VRAQIKFLYELLQGFLENILKRARALRVRERVKRLRVASMRGGILDFL